MKIEDCFTGLGVLGFLWFVGFLDFAPKLAAQLGSWDGASTIDRIGSKSMRWFGDQWQAKLGDKPVNPAEAKALSDKCKPSTAADGVRLPYSKYQEHLNAIKLKTRSPLQDKNMYTFCEGDSNRMFSKLVGTDKYIYLPDWKQGVALIINGSNGGESVINIPNSDEQQK